MRFTSAAFIFAATLLTPFVAADLHYSGLCVTKEGGQNVYHDAATRGACTAYKNRNTGNKQWDQCPDCVIQEKGGLTFCHSEGQHIGGDELSHYCGQQGSGIRSLAD
ncbi:hypothetical protein B0J11DRAFT_572018 [Dendryphion nanum]|uniref:Uncharacterized protein n=1 Tax=Dendryphion nanum TaxID=256645 RepID=A0A9P9ID16_9PLEO|nr:hypothetical protein B0J11DRAFT_572018 [Dendryphion nanum]